MDNARRAVELLGRTDVVAAWLRNIALGEEDEDEPHWDRWAWDIVDGLTEDADGCWSMILDLVASADDAELVLVGAGPLEDWICTHAPEHIDRVESEAARNAQLRLALQATWVWSSVSEETFERVAAAAGSRVDAPSTPEAAAERRALRAQFYDLCASYVPRGK